MKNWILDPLFLSQIFFYFQCNCHITTDPFLSSKVEHHLRTILQWGIHKQCQTFGEREGINLQKKWKVVWKSHFLKDIIYEQPLKFPSFSSWIKKIQHMTNVKLLGIFDFKHFILSFLLWLNNNMKKVYTLLLNIELLCFKLKENICLVMVQSMMMASCRKLKSVYLIFNQQLIEYCLKC